MAAVSSPSRPDNRGKLSPFARFFKRQSSKEKCSDEEDLSRLLRQTYIASSPLNKPLPTSAAIGTSSQLQYSQHNRLPQSISYHVYPSNDSNSKLLHHGHHAGPSNHQQDYLPHMPMPIPSPYSHQQHTLSVDHVSGKKLPNPWELDSSLPVVNLTQRRPDRPLSAPVITTKIKVSRRPKSIVIDPLQLPGRHQCWGIKRDGTRCTRRIASPSGSPSKGRSPSKSPNPRQGRPAHGPASKVDTIVVSDSDDLSDECSSHNDLKYCHQHSREINKNKGSVLPGRAKGNEGDGVYVDFNEVFKGILSRGGQEEEQLKAKLRTVMCQSASEVDWKERGYIYIYELRDRSTNTHIALKVGRAVNVYKRLDQWRTQCQSKDPTLRAFFPRPEGVAQDVLPGVASVVEKGVLLSHRWEKLIHMELSYLGNRLDDKCIDCGSRHREIFSIPREMGNERVGYEGVQRAVERWLAFVRSVAGDD